MTPQKIQRGFTVFGILILLFNIYEYLTQQLPPGEMKIIIVECIAGILLIYLPQIIKKVFKLQLPTTIIYFYWFFLWLSVFMGTCLHLIRFINGWDKVLHTVSPMLLTAVGYGFINLLLIKTPTKSVSPWLFLLFGFAFAGVCGVFWEFWEFLCDSLGNMNLQRYLDSPDSSGPALIGRAALMDTMGDLVTNTIGAIIMGLYSWYQVRKNKSYFATYQIMTLKKQ